MLLSIESGYASDMLSNETVKLYSKDPAIARRRVPRRYLADFLEETCDHNREGQLLWGDLLVLF
jgi:hypothetical protein